RRGRTGRPRPAARPGRGGGQRPRARPPPRTRRRRRRAGGRPPPLLGTVRPVSPALLLPEGSFHSAKLTIDYNVQVRAAKARGRGSGRRDTRNPGRLNAMNPGFHVLSTSGLPGDHVAEAAEAVGDAAGGGDDQLAQAFLLG